MKTLVNNRLFAILAICAVAVLAFQTEASAQRFNKKVILENLDNPQGIHLDLFGNLYYSEVPTPGVMGEESGNKVTRYQGGKKRVISEGEPYPINLASDVFGNVYWTCQSAGVIIKSSRFGRGKKQVILEGLNKPTGLASTKLGVLFFTEIPSPGEAGEDNTVKAAFSFFRRYFTFMISDGEPEPSDVAVGRDGTVYWTCKTAGVILSRNISGDINVVRDNLNSPVGIDIDVFGRIYYTEVPTPGVMGEESENRVVMFNPRNGKEVVISTGEPEPADVSVSLTGHRIYWTCKTAGVIIRATRKNRRK